MAGLPAAFGLFTALVPMVIYALLGTSRVLSVSSNTALAILGYPVGACGAGGGEATLTALVGVMLVVPRLLKFAGSIRSAGP